MEETPQLFPVLLRLMFFYLQRAEFQTAWELSEQCQSLAQRLQDPMRLLEVYQGSGTVLFWRGELTQAQAYFEEGMHLYAVAQPSLSSLHRQGPGVTCLTYAALSLWLLGYPDQALHRSQEALTLVRTVSRPFLLAYTLTGVVLLHQLRREEHHVQEQAEAIITVSREEGFPYFLAIGLIFRGWALARQGQEEEGMAQLHQGLATYRNTGAKMAQSYLLTFLAEAYGAGGQPEAGLRVLDEALAAVHDTGERMYEAELYRLKGEPLADAVDGPYGGSRGVLAPGPHYCLPPARKIPGATGGAEPPTTVAAAGQAGGGLRVAGTDLWLVHRGICHGRSSGGQDVARGPGVNTSLACLRQVE